MFYNVVLVSTTQQYESAIHMYVCTCIHTYIYLLLFGFPSHLGHCGAFPVLYSRISLVIYFIHSVNSVYTSIPICQFILSTQPLMSICQTLFNIAVISALFHSLCQINLNHMPAWPEIIRDTLHKIQN